MMCVRFTAFRVFISPRRQRSVMTTSDRSSTGLTPRSGRLQLLAGVLPGVLCSQSFCPDVCMYFGLHQTIAIDDFVAWVSLG